MGTRVAAATARDERRTFVEAPGDVGVLVEQASEQIAVDMEQSRVTDRAERRALVVGVRIPLTEDVADVKTIELATV